MMIVDCGNNDCSDQVCAKIMTIDDGDDEVLCKWIQQRLWIGK